MGSKFFEKYIGDSRKGIVILLIGIVLVIIMLFYALKVIWFDSGKKDKDENENSSNTTQVSTNISEITLGNYRTYTDGNVKMLKEYFTDIFKVLSSGTKKEIFDIVSKDYIEKYKYNETTLYNKLKNKNLVGKAFQCLQYAEVENPRFGRIYSLEISSVDSKVLDSLIIIEESPRNYKIAFDGYIGKKEQDVEVIREGLKLSIINVEETKSRVYFDIIIQNLNENDIILNYQGVANEAIYVGLNQDKKIYNTLTFFGGQEIKLKPSASVQAKVGFLLSDLQSGLIDKMAIVNVYNVNTETTTDFIYDIYK